MKNEHTIIPYWPQAVNEGIRECRSSSYGPRNANQRSGRGERIRTSGLYVPNVSVKCLFDYSFPRGYHLLGQIWDNGGFYGNYHETR